MDNIHTHTKPHKNTHQDTQIHTHAHAHSHTHTHIYTYSHPRNMNDQWIVTINLKSLCLSPLSFSLSPTHSLCLFLLLFPCPSPHSIFSLSNISFPVPTPHWSLFLSPCLTLSFLVLPHPLPSFSHPLFLNIYFPVCLSFPSHFSLSPTLSLFFSKSLFLLSLLSPTLSFSHPLWFSFGISLSLSLSSPFSLSPTLSDSLFRNLSLSKSLSLPLTSLAPPSLYPPWDQIKPVAAVYIFFIMHVHNQIRLSQ